jgi:hypothetical protein
MRTAVTEQRSEYDFERRPKVEGDSGRRAADVTDSEGWRNRADWSKICFIKIGIVKLGISFRPGESAPDIKSVQQ